MVMIIKVMVIKIIISPMITITTMAPSTLKKVMWKLWETFQFLKEIKNTFNEMQQNLE